MELLAIREITEKILPLDLLDIHLDPVKMDRIGQVDHQIHIRTPKEEPGTEELVVLAESKNIQEILMVLAKEARVEMEL